jgi:SAM-dependent methyltransferase
MNGCRAHEDRENAVMGTRATAMKPDRHLINQEVFAHLPDSRQSGSWAGVLARGWRHRMLLAAMAAVIIPAVVVRTAPAVAMSFLLLGALWAWDAYVRRCREWERYGAELDLFKKLLASESVETFYASSRDEGTFAESLKELPSFGDRPARQADPVYCLRHIWLGRLLARFFQRAEATILDLGCQHGLMTTLFDRAGWSFIGVDLNPESLRIVHAAHQRWPLARVDAAALPFPGEHFDLINFSEVIEHLSDPRAALREIRRCLRPGGLFFLTTNNRHGLLWSDWINPLSVAEKLIGLGWPAVLPPPALVWSHETLGLSYYHTNFTAHEIRDLLLEAGLEIVWWRSYHHLGEAHHGLLKLFPNWTERQAAGVLHAVDRICNTLPLLNRLGMYWLIVGRKPADAASAR